MDPAVMTTDSVGRAMDTADGAVDSAGMVVDTTAIAEYTVDSAAAGVEKAAAAPPRCLALELEIFACGTINVSYMIGFIKGCFQQVIP